MFDVHVRIEIEKANNRYNIWWNKYDACNKINAVGREIWNMQGSHVVDDDDKQL